MDSNTLLELIKTRRSIRKFLPGSIPESDIEKMVCAASWAPSGSNSQNWRFIAVKSAAVIKEMYDAVNGQINEYAGLMASKRAKDEFINYSGYLTFFGSAPVVIAAVKKPYDSLTRRILERYGLAGDYVSTADVQGPAAAIENLLLTAHVLGYGACWMTGPMIAKKKLEAVLGINEPDELMALIPIGKAEGTVVPPKRKEVTAILEYK